MLHLKLRNWIVTHGPRIARRPLTVVPFHLYQPVIKQLLDRLLAEPLEEGDIDFLEQRWLTINVTDLGLSFSITVDNGHLLITPAQAQSGVVFSAEFNDLLLVASRREDPDTLFFQRRLNISGDTELGLEVKNLLAALDMDSLPAWLLKGSNFAADWVQAARQSEPNTIEVV
jgi:predicted lipid carrier protein YhbT